MSRTSLFHTHFEQTRYQIKAETPTHMAKHTELFLCLLFLNYRICFLVRRNFFEQVYEGIKLTDVFSSSLYPVLTNLEIRSQFI